MSTKDLIERLNRTQTTTRRSAEKDGEDGRKVAGKHACGPASSAAVASLSIGRGPRSSRSQQAASEQPAAAKAEPEAAETAPAEATEASRPSPRRRRRRPPRKRSQRRRSKPSRPHRKPPSLRLRMSLLLMPRLTTHPQRLRHRPLRASLHRPPMPTPPRQPQGTPAEEGTADAAAADETSSDQPKAGDSTPEDAASTLASGLPRADGSPGRRLPRLGAVPGREETAFTGLGSAVVKPPPGYDPNNPEATRKAAEAARTAEREKRWQNQSGKASRRCNRRPA